MEIDHVLVRVDDLEHDVGIASVAGGRHPGWGTANRIIPLGNVYIELIAVVDEEEASHTPFGRRALAAPPGPIGWCVRPDSIDAEAARLGLTVQSASRVSPDGETITWRLAGIEQALAEPALPFFIAWDDPARHPGRGGEGRITRLALSGDARRVADWLGPHRLPIEIRPGTPQVEGVTLMSSNGPISF